MCCQYLCDKILKFSFVQENAMQKMSSRWYIDVEENKEEQGFLLTVLI